MKGCHVSNATSCHIYITKERLVKTNNASALKHHAHDSISTIAAHREASIRAVTLFVEHVADLTPHLAYLFPVLMARGVPTGSLFDPALELFVHDADEHAAFKRYATRRTLLSTLRHRSSCRRLIQPWTMAKYPNPRKTCLSRSSSLSRSSIHCCRVHRISRIAVRCISLEKRIHKCGEDRKTPSDTFDRS